MLFRVSYAIACLCIEMQRISTLLTPCVHMCAAAKACPAVCRCHAIRPVLLQAVLLGRLNLLQGKQCMCLLLCLCNTYSRIVPYVPFQTQLGSQAKFLVKLLRCKNCTVTT